MGIIKNKKKSLILLFVIVSSLLFVLGVNSNNEKQNIQYPQRGQTWEVTELGNGKYSLILYGGTRFVYEDKTWKKIEEARSLKGWFSIEYLSKEDGLDIVVTDFNYTSVQGYLIADTSFIGKEMPLIILEPNKNFNVKKFQELYPDKKITYKDTHTLKNLILSNFSKVNEKKYFKVPFALDNLLEFGFNSTVVSLHDNKTEILEDTSTFNNSLLNMRNSTALETGNTDYLGGIHNTWIWMKFNMSKIYDYSNYTIVSAKLSVYHEDNSGQDFHSSKTYSVFGISNQTWTDLVCTDQLKNCPGLSSTIATGISPSGSDSDYYWQDFDVASWVQNQRTAANKNISFMINRTFNPSLEDYCWFDSKEESYPQNRPYLNITFDDGSQQTNLMIFSIKPIQVVYDVDLVLNKDGYVIVQVYNDGNISINASVISYFGTTKLTPIEAECQLVEAHKLKDFVFNFTPNLEGYQKINASVGFC